VLKVGSADPADWPNNEIIKQLQIPSPLAAAAMATATEDMGMMTPEATASS